MNEPMAKKVALIEWNHLIEDFLDNIGLSMDDYTERMTGGWLFGYIDALKLSGVETVLFCFSSRVNAVQYHIHKPTGAQILVLPSPRFYRKLRRVILNPYESHVEKAVKNAKKWQKPFYKLALHTASWFNTPMRLLKREIKKQQCSVILCQEYEHARFDLCAIIAKKLKMPLYATFQGGYWQQSFFERYIRRFTLRWCAGLIIASGIEIERVQKKYGLPSKKIAQVSNPIDLAMWQGAGREETRKLLALPSHKWIAIWHGRIDYLRKGLDVMIDSWEKVCENNGPDDIALIIIGDGNDRELLRQRLQTSSAKNITWINEYTNDRKKIYAYLKSANAYLFASRSEGFAVAPLEAMACGLPLVATNAPGIPDVLQDGKNSGGIMIEQEDSSAFADAILFLLQNKANAENMGRLAEKNVVENFSSQAVGIQLKQFLFSQHKQS